jgi:outer membrane protein assembly factor BamD (BamD/ComL family)
MVMLAREIEDRLVYRDRELAGARFAEAQTHSDVAHRKQELEAVAESLQSLASKYPDSRYADGVQSSLVTVNAALAEDSQ